MLLFITEEEEEEEVPETGWLVETHKGGVPLWFYFDANGLPSWTSDSLEALRLSRQTDAEALHSWVSKWHDLDSPLTFSEHQWG